jgi:bifunctional UDP-N-acetylglucosamine pyrophosphorylase/glucosamine-1-phosphate N-acetyltransferase
MNIVILAAGQGKRMVSSLPKVLHPLAGKPMLGHVLSTVLAIDPDVRPCVVVGHGQEYVREYLRLNFSNVEIAVQDQQLGTGHAVKQATSYLSEDTSTLILYGDVPLIQ